MKDKPSTTISRLFSDYITPIYDWNPNETILDFSLSKGVNIAYITNNYRKIVTLVADETQYAAASEQIEKDKLAEKIEVEYYADNMRFQHEFDVVTFIGSIHHTDPVQSLQLANANIKSGGKVIIFDGFFSMPVRESYTVLSRISEPSNKKHLTYHEIMHSLRTNGFEPLKIVPVYFKRPLEKTISYYPENIKDIVRNIFLTDEVITSQMHVSKEGDEWFYFYELFVLIAEKRTPTIVSQY